MEPTTCPRCGGPHDSPGKSRCSGCLRKSRDILDARVAAGLCRQCGKGPPAPDRRNCATCLAKAVEHKARKLAGRLLAGQCYALGCPRKAAKGDRYCAEHRAAQTAYQRDYKRASRRPPSE